MKKRWPHGWRDDADAMARVREHGRREHTMSHMDCPVCVRFWTPTRDPLRKVTTRRGGGITRSQLDALYRADPHIEDDPADLSAS